MLTSNMGSGSCFGHSTSNPALPANDFGKAVGDGPQWAPAAYVGVLQEAPGFCLCAGPALGVVAL